MPKVHAVAVDADLVVLDLKSDAYYCLPDLGRHLEVVPGMGWSPSSAAVREGLLQTGLFRTGPGPVDRKPAPVIRTSRQGELAPPDRLADARLLAVIAMEAWRIGNRPVLDLLRRSPDLPVRPDQEEVAMTNARLFSDRSIWIPGQGLCLYRAFLLRRFLAAGGIGSSWVFGVRTWPFSAHCWLQVGEALLDDDPDRVRMYTPILTVSG